MNRREPEEVVEAWSGIFFLEGLPAVTTQDEEAITFRRHLSELGSAARSVLADIDSAPEEPYFEGLKFLSAGIREMFESYFAVSQLASMLDAEWLVGFVEVA